VAAVGDERLPLIVSLAALFYYERIAIA